MLATMLALLRQILINHVRKVNISVTLGIAALTFCAPLRSNAAVVVTAKEAGGNVVFSGGGTLNLSDLTPVLSANWINGFLSSSVGIYQGAGTGASTGTPGTIYVGAGFTGPTSFGTASGFIADVVAGDFGGIRGSSNPGVLVSDAYISGSSFFGTSTFLGKTFASLGLTPGTYDWTWGTANPDSYRLVIGNSSNVPGPLPLFGVGAAFGWSRRLRKRIATPSITPPRA
jgi:hypothetical protein